MKEKITEILNDDTIESVEARVDKLTKEMALLTIPKNKFNDLSTRLKNVEDEKAVLQTELDDLKVKSMTDEQLKAKQTADFEKKVKELAIETNKVKARSLFKEANISDSQIEDLLGKVVSDDETKTIELANSFIGILSTKIDETKKETTADLITKTPKPSVVADVKEAKILTVEDFVNMEYSDKKKLLADDPEQYKALTTELNK